ncbi:MAG TPA: DMT family transporter [Bordetella sp.]|nr:DMT family transporter [Bordetella sp.]
MPPPSSIRPTASAGILCILCGMVCLTISDATAKWLVGIYPPTQILFLRCAIALPVIAAVAVALGGRHALRTRHPGVHLLRGAINVVSATAFYASLRYLPLAESTAISYAAPLCVMLLSVFVLKERVDILRWGAIACGFAGVLLIVRPGTASFQAAALLPLATAVLYAIMMVTARAIGPSEGFLTMAVYIVAAQLVCSATTLPWFWHTPDPAHWPFFVSVALFSTLGLSLITQAFRIAPASVVAPFDYTGLLWAALLGWVFWRETPDAVTFIGAAIIVAAGLTIILRETMRPRKKVSPDV